MIDAYKKSYLHTLYLAEQRFLYGLEKTPDERLTWAPGEKASSPLKIAGKLIGFLSFLSYAVANKQFPQRDGATPEPPATREAAAAAVAQGFAALKAAVEGLTEADVEVAIPAPWGTSMIVLEWLNLANGAMGYFMGQLNGTQLAYGDEDPNIPPAWTAKQD